MHNIDIRLQEIKLQQRITELDIKQHGPAIYLSLLSETPKACSIDIYVPSLNSGKGLKLLLDRIKGFFFEFGFTPCKAEQPLGGMELQEKSTKTITGYRKPV